MCSPYVIHKAWFRANGVIMTPDGLRWGVSAPIQHASVAVVAQSGPAGIVGGFLLLAGLSTLLANTAAYFVTGDTHLRRALFPGVAIAVVMLLQAVLPVIAVILLALVVDFTACRIAFGLNRRGTVTVTAVHYALIVGLSYLIQSSLAIYQTAPG